MTFVRFFEYFAGSALLLALVPLVLIGFYAFIWLLAAAIDDIGRTIMRWIWR